MFSSDRYDELLLYYVLFYQFLFNVILCSGMIVVTVILLIPKWYLYIVLFFSFYT